MLNLQNSMWLTPERRCYMLSSNCENLRTRICRLFFCIVLGPMCYIMFLYCLIDYTYFIFGVKNQLNIINLVISVLVIETSVEMPALIEDTYFPNAFLYNVLKVFAALNIKRSWFLNVPTCIFYPCSM